MNPTDLPISVLLVKSLHTFAAGLLVALGAIATLAQKPLGDSIFKQAGLYLLAAAASAVTFGAATSGFFPERVAAWLDPISLGFGAIAFALWGVLSARLLSDSLSARRLASSQRLVATLGLVMAALSMIPYTPSHLVAEGILGILTPTLGTLTLVAALRAHREGNDSAATLALGSILLLICTGALWALNWNWVSHDVGMSLLDGALCLQGLLLGWTVLHRIGRLRLAAEQAQATMLANADWKAADLEDLVEARNSELRIQFQALEESQHSAQLANAALQRAMELLETASCTDSLTGAWNRRRFEEAALAQMALTLRREEPLSLIVMDLDHFKRVNDTCGHSVGDEVLVGMAKLVRQLLRASDQLVRWGGEEFLVLAPGTSLAGAVSLAEKLRQALAAEPFPSVGQVTMSLGVAQFALGENLKDWIDRADQALYEAKARGRNQVVEAPAPAPWAAADERVPVLLEEGWSPRLECGDALMDAQHRNLHQLGTEILSQSAERTATSELLVRLETLLAHAAQHFHDEETLLRELQYPNMKGHIGLHQELLHKARYILDEAAAGRVEMAALVQYLVRDLVGRHIDHDDRDYFPLVRTRTVVG